MAWTSDDVAALKTAIKAGVKRVRYHDHDVEYHSLTEMLELLGAMKAEVDAATGIGNVTFAGRVE